MPSGLSVWEKCLRKLSLTACCRAGSASAPQSYSRARSQTVISHQCFQAAFLCEEQEGRTIFWGTITSLQADTVFLSRDHCSEAEMAPGTYLCTQWLCPDIRRVRDGRIHTPIKGEPQNQTPASQECSSHTPKLAKHPAGMHVVTAHPWTGYLCLHPRLGRTTQITQGRHWAIVSCSVSKQGDQWVGAWSLHAANWKQPLPLLPQPFYSV